ncbi:TBC1 domain family member whacked isoform X1 [Cydia pomonella]|uniref:TBC1 domain family member whacked isoform X1 n=1 Tax=Cydia pomonella TaxID=82600 RepID=UPI002ADE286E|nr:TBC1 domain family member whacked isoform X1 [Cydia pomonella]
MSLQKSVKSAGGDRSEQADTTSICSSVTTQPDRHGFFGGAQYSPEPKRTVSPSTILKREQKWLRMLNKWEAFMSKNYKKVRERCRKGIPASVRPRAWLYLCGGELLMKKHPTEYEELLAAPGDPKCMDDIRKDLHRQFPYHEMFIREEGPGQQELFSVLKAYSVFNPKVGYFQAQAPVAAFLLMHMPAVQAFWCLVSISDKYLSGYYNPGLEVLQRDGDILHALLRRTAPAVHRHLVKHKVEPVLYATEWFLCALTRTLPWDSLLRVWDCFLCEGVKVLFKAALVILAGALGPAKVRKRAAGLCETLEALRHPPEAVLAEKYLMYHMQRLGLTEEDFEFEHQRQTARRRALSNRRFVYTTI